MKLGLKVGVMFSSLVLSMVCLVGCNSDEATPAAGTGAGASKAPADKPATPAPKPDEKK